MMPPSLKVMYRTQMQTPDCVNLNTVVNTNQIRISRSTLHLLLSKYRTTCMFVQRLYIRYIGLSPHIKS